LFEFKLNDVTTVGSPVY